MCLIVSHNPKLSSFCSYNIPLKIQPLRQYTGFHKEMCGGNVSTLVFIRICPYEKECTDVFS